MPLFPPDRHCVVQIHAQIERLVKSSIRYSKFDHGLTQEQLSTLIEEAFWASLRSNEGRPTRVRLAVATPEQFPGATAFASPLRYEETEIVKLAQAVPLDGCLGVALANGSLQIWGFAGWRGLATVTIEITEPGTVRVDVGPFRPYAILDGRSNDVIGATDWDLAYHLQRKLAKALPNDDLLETQAVPRECLALADLVRMILSDGHGGAVLLVPSETGEWSESLKPFPYRLKTPDTTVRDAIRKELNDEDNKGKGIEEFLQAAPSDDRVIGAFYHALGAFHLRNDGGQRGAIEAIASLAKVDGAVVMTRDMQLLGFGAKIEFRPDRDVPVCKFKPLPSDQEAVPLPLEDLGGMRHQSAARFIVANKGTVVIVVSQDRHVSVMNWEDELKSVCVVRNAEWWV
jgi:hypothetical protein